ncbi:MAG TPA: hypothetical protein VEB66_05790 [Opitutaceae bacterium]|nr:hypothetical protein [Opitutaceae bacterium]
MPRTLIAALVVLLLGASGFGAAQLAEARRLRRNEAALAQERDELLRRIAELQKARRADPVRAEAGPGDAAAAENPGDAPVPATSGGEPGGPRMAFRAGGPGARRAFDALNTPEAQQLMSIQQRAALDGRYAALFRQLRLSPAELEQFKQLLVEKGSAVMDVMGAARAQGLTGREARNEIRQLVESTQAEIDATIRSTLGEAAYTQYKNYEATLPQRGVAEQLERRLSYTDAPLSPAQVEQVVQILHETSTGGGGGRDAAGPIISMALGGSAGSVAFSSVGGGGTRITDQTLTRAQGVLMPQQLAALQALQQEQAAAQRLQQQMRANFEMRRPAEAASTPATPPGGR